jgi:hypothetical protein
MTDFSGHSETSYLEKKKGRKPKEKEVTEATYYFDVREEQAVIDYLTATTVQEKNRIYNAFLRGPIDKMISAIIRKYKLNRKDLEFEETHNDTHSFLMTKFDKFDPTKGYKAYSYFGTTCKNYLIGQINKDKKDTNRKISYEDISSDLENSYHLSYNLETEISDPKNIIKRFLDDLKIYLDECEMDQKKLTENELKIGYALHDMFENYENIFMLTSNNKFNKNVILHSLREMTNMNTKDIRASMKKFKNIYIKMLRKMLKQ